MLADVERLRAVSEGAQVSEPITVMIADDHELVARSLRLGLSREGDMAVLADAGEASTTTCSVAARMPRVLVLIVQAANGLTVELIRRLRAQAPATAIVVLTGQDAPTFAATVMDLGVRGYVLTDEAEGELPYAIRSAAKGVAYVSPRVAVQLEALRRVSAADGLSVRETEVLRLIALGFTSCEIAEQLYLSQRTIETHRSQICRKLGLEKRWALVRYALSRRLIGDPDTVAWERAGTGDGRIRNQKVDRAREAMDRASVLAEEAQAVVGQARHVQARTNARLRANEPSDYHTGPQ
jgi:DNA-binding NarL/FixJ family response regulator